MEDKESIEICKIELLLLNAIKKKIEEDISIIEKWKYVILFTKLRETYYDPHFLDGIPKPKTFRPL